MLREFTFKNNLFCDKIQMIDSEYSVIGYYDGMDMKIFQDDENDYLNVLSDPNKTMLEEIDENHIYECYNIVGMRNDYDVIAEKSFWEDDTLPFIFVSSVRLRESALNIDELIDHIETKTKSWCYVSLDSSDLIICSRADTYSEGYFCIEQYWELVGETGNKIQKCFTNLVIKQSILDTIESGNTLIKDETVSCVLRGVIRDWKNVNNFLKKLNCECKGVVWEQFGTLGSDDIVIKTECISTLTLFTMYKKRGVLTHDDPDYKATFVNVSTEILVKRNKEVDGGTE